MNTAVLFLTFNRLDTTKQVFEEIRKAQPPRLYLASDGSRPNVVGENQKVQSVREYILSLIDWDCEVKTLFRDRNLGCKYAVSGAIDWFFENEEMGIIIEDDCLPDQSFFEYCQEMLGLYKSDSRVWQVAGFNPLGCVELDQSYYFSKYGPIWGWATWATRWKYYDAEMKSWPLVRETKVYESFGDNAFELNWRMNLFDSIFTGKVDTWDYQWAYAKLLNSGLTITPHKNLIKNIGFGANATHTTTMEVQPTVYSLPLPLIHSPYVVRNKRLEVQFFQKFVHHTILRRVLKKIKKVGICLIHWLRKSKQSA